MGPRKLLRGLVFFLSVVGHATLQPLSLLFPHLSFLASALGRLMNTEWEGTCRRHSDAQVSKEVWHSVARAL